MAASRPYPGCRRPPRPPRPGVCTAACPSWRGGAGPGRAGAAAGMRGCSAALLRCAAGDLLAGGPAWPEDTVGLSGCACAVRSLCCQLSEPSSCLAAIPAPRRAAPRSASQRGCPVCAAAPPAPHRAPPRPTAPHRAEVRRSPHAAPRTNCLIWISVTHFHFHWLVPVITARHGTAALLGGGRVAGAGASASAGAGASR